VYNTANQMVSSSDGSYLYDGHNKRVKKVDGQGISYSMYSKAGQLVYRKVNNIDTDYYYLGNKLVAKKAGNAKTYIHTDFLGSPAAESNEVGSVERLHYEPFGDTIEAAREEVGYTGHKFDKDLGLSYMQARYYDPVIGRFYSNDPIGYTAKNPVMSFNRYLYVNNNPYKYTDPDGEWLQFVVIGAKILHKAYKTYKKVQRAKKMDKAVDKVTKDSKYLGKKHGTKHYKKTGDRGSADKDLNKLPGDKTQTRSNGTKTKDTSEGGSANTHTGTAKGRKDLDSGNPKLEIKRPPGKTNVKVEYVDK